MTNPADPNVAVMPDSGSTAGKALPPRLQRAMSRVTEIGSLPEITKRSSLSWRIRAPRRRHA